MSAPRRKRTRFQQARGTSRRQFLKGLGAGGISMGVLHGCGSEADTVSAASGSGNSVSPSSTNGNVANGAPVSSCSAGPSPGTDSANGVFQHGVATGDPTPTSVIFWTAISNATRDTDVTLEIFRDEALTRLERRLCTKATLSRAYTVKIDVTGLQSDTTYYYRFISGAVSSAIGRTKTTPASDTRTIKLGVVSCSSYAHGFFNAYMQLSKRTELDAIVHLGDYIYEYGNGEYGDVRNYEPPGEIFTLEHYRTRHAYYKRTDPDLKELHRLFPFITIWDDHESTDNSYRDAANNHTEGTEGNWIQRKGFAQKAYDEWMPIRLPEPGNPNRIWRRLKFGDLIDMFLLDTRLFDRDVPAGAPINPASDPFLDENRKLIGPTQMNWLLNGLQSSTAKWKLMGSQVVFHQWSVRPGIDGNIPADLRPLVGPTGLNGDSWDGYIAERKKITAVLRGDGGKPPVKNVVVLTGDVHSSWVADITDDPNNPSVYNPLTGEGSLATEFVGPSVTSPGLPIPDAAVNLFRTFNPHIKYINMSQKGYMLLTVAADKVVCQYWYVSGIDARGGTESLAREFTVLVDTNRIAGLPSPT